ncbi:hypothetical protein OIO90_006085 [Microbotryomycetes sp. JL221]|nr:hypothetical protein OIO90_006085 [Microbotryomycetes sp. JL221]
MQAPPPVNGSASGLTPALDVGPNQNDVNAQIDSNSTSTSTSTRLAALCAALGTYTFKETVGNEPNVASTQYILPPDVKEQTFLAFVRDVESIVGPDNVVVNLNAQAQAEAGYESQPKFFDFFAIQSKEANMASCAIQPKSTEEVVAIVKAANQHKMPISPVSIGRNLGYGGTAPRLKGAATVDLKRMNRVLEVNEDSAYVLVEPGVSYFNMYEHLRKIGSNLWIDCPDIGWGSMIGNMTERGAGYTPYGDHFMMHCGMEVVLPTGDVVRTGMGALPDNNTWQLFQYGFGPYHDGIFTQSNFGIVTKAGFWLMPNPGGYKPFLVTVPRKEDLHELVERIRPLRISMIIQNAPTIRHVLLDAACMKSKSEWLDGSPDRILTEDDELKIADELGIGYWNFYGALYGPSPMTDMLWSVIWGSLSQIKGAKCFFEDEVPPTSILHSRAKTLAGIPNLLELDWISWLPNGAHCFFSPISPVTGPDAVKQFEFVQKRAHEYGFDFFLTLVVGLKEMHNICCLVFNREDPDQVRRMNELIKVCIDDAARLGYGEYRTHIAFMDQIAGTYNYNNNAIMKLNETIKDSLDPNGILAPGKSGIWPKRYRELQAGQI